CRPARRGDAEGLTIFQADGASSGATNPHVLCDPSQNGRVPEWPQRHRAIFSLPVGSGKALPRWSITLIAPSLTRGPFSRQRMTSGSDMVLLIDRRGRGWVM